MPVDPLDATAPLVDLLARLLLHEGHPHAAEESNAVGVEYVVASMAFVAVIGGLLYWYFGRVETR